MHLFKYSYSKTDYPWLGKFEELYGVSELERLHTVLPSYREFKPENDSSTILHKVFYSNFASHFGSLYLSFVHYIATILEGDFYYQEIPCVRFGLPNYSWLTEFHRDGDYAHPEQEININLAITSSLGTAALQIEDMPGSGNYISLQQDFGEFTLIDHIGCKHGTIINEENYTLVSLDFRLIPVSMAERAFSDKSSLLIGKRFKPGHYFSALPVFRSHNKK